MTTVHSKKEVVEARNVPERIRRNLDKEFLKQAEGLNLDLSGCPSVAPPPTDTDFLDHRFAPLCDDGKVRAVAIKKWLRDKQMDPEVRSTIRDAVRNGLLPEQGDIDDGENKIYHVDGEPVLVEKKSGTWQASFRGTLYSGSTREGVALSVAREAQGVVREPTEQAKLEIARFVSGLNAATSPQQAEEIFVIAVKKYILAANGPTDETTLSTVRFLPLVNAAVRFCWETVRTDFSPDADWPDFLEDFAGTRPYTALLLNNAANAYLSASRVEKRMGAAEPGPQAAPTYDDINDLTDEAVAHLYRDVSKEYARTINRLRLS